VKDLAIGDQDLLSFISIPSLTVNLCLLSTSYAYSHYDRMRKCQNTANEHPTSVSYNAHLLLFLPVSFILTTASGPCLDLTLLKPAHSISDYKSAYQNGTYKRYQQAQSERKLRLLWKCDRSQEKKAVLFEKHGWPFIDQECTKEEASAIEELFQETL
jgi:hypothetical protein